MNDAPLYPYNICHLLEFLAAGDDADHAVADSTLAARALLYVTFFKDTYICSTRLYVLDPAAGNHTK